MYNNRRYRDNLGRLDGQEIIQCNIRDITHRRQAEHALEQLNAEMHTILEARVQERTAELAAAYEALHREKHERLRAEEKERFSVMEERTRIAREIHDTLAQGFTGILLQLEVADDALHKDIEVARAHLQRARTLARESLTEARRSMSALRPRLLEEGNLAIGFAKMIELFPHEESMALEFALEGELCPLPPDMEHDLLRIGQEALNNAVKYAHACSIRVTLLFNDHLVTLRVEDDGQGFDPSQRHEQAFGLRIMAERAERQGGKLTIASQLGHGTCLEALMPFPADDDRGLTNA